MPTFLSKLSEIKKGIFTITGKEAHHLTRVLRVQKGEQLKITDGEGHLFEATIIELNRGVTLQILRTLPPLPPPFPVQLFLSLLKSEKMEWVVQKAVELNVEAVHLVCAERSIREEISDSKWQRLGKIAGEAQKQCGRPSPLRLSKSEGSLTELLKREAQKKGTHLFFREDLKEGTFKNLFKKGLAPPYTLWIGPEGGWDPVEIETAKQNKLHSVSLGPLILRSETAALHALSSLITLAF